MDDVRLNSEPQLNDPFMLAAWPGMGGVAIIATRYLVEKWEAEEWGNIDTEGFFDLNGVLIEDSVVKDIQFPENAFYLARGHGGRDWIIFTGEAQPLANGYHLANLILDVAQKFGVKRVHTFAAAPTHIHHTKKPKVSAAATSAELASELEKHDIHSLKEGSISGMNGLLLGVAKQRDMDALCLLGEIPIYTTQIANPRASRAVLDVLAQTSGLEVDFSDIDQWAQETDAQVAERISQLKESFGEEARGLIDYFEQLAEQTDEDESQQQYRTEELLQEIEKFLKEEGGQKEGH